MDHSRQLAAIMFTDIEGYSAIMQMDEQKAIMLKDRHRIVVENEHKKFNGNIIHYYGDGSLSIFTSAVQAVQCAIKMQLKFCQSPNVPVRIGLHMGDIVLNDGNVFGDGVNLASRIESLGVAGSVLISDKVNDELHNQPGFKTLSMGTYNLKNIEREVEVFALNHEGLVKPIRNSLRGKTGEKKMNAREFSIPKKSIAVLPFLNLSNDEGQEFFSDGVAEEIINSLAHLKDLKVAGRTSSFQFKNTKADLREIGEKLGVSNVLEGSVRKQGNLLRVTAQLIDVKDGYHLWSERYDSKMDDIFAIQDEIALAITEKLKVTLLEKDRERIIKSYTQNHEAYELYLKGRFYLNRRGVSIILGIECFQKAIEIDPDFALPHVGFSDANLLMATYGLAPPKIVLPKAKQSAERAIELDPSLCEPYCSLGYYYTCFEWNWAEAKKNFLTSIELNPQYVDVHYRYGWNFLSWVEGSFEEALKHGEIAIKLEPLSSICYGTYSLILHTARKFSEALGICQTGIDLDANSFLCRVNEGSIYMALKQYDKAIASCKIAMDISNRHHFALNGLIWNYCLIGNFDEAKALMDEIIERSKKEYTSYT
ncbi:MAG: adenylate/guanylate cyclase domain-containing protein, partial [Ginsengibacter sp.]